MFDLLSQILNADERKKLTENRRSFESITSVKNIDKGRVVAAFIAVVQLAMIVLSVLNVNETTWVRIASLTSSCVLLVLCVLFYALFQRALNIGAKNTVYNNTLTIAFVACALVLSGVLSALEVYGGGFPLMLIVTMTAVAGLQNLKPLFIACLYLPVMITYVFIDQLVVNPRPDAGYLISLICFFAIVLTVAFTIYYGRVRDYLVTLNEEESRSSLIDANQKLLDLNNQLEQISMTDRLTGLKNRWAYNEDLEAMFNRCKAAQTPMALVIFDLDNFKLINDRLGHSVGDKCLISVADTLNHHLTWAGAYRYGGEEFIMLFEGRSEAAVAAIAEEIRAKIEKMAHTDRELKITISGGVYMRVPDDETNIEKYLVNADRALYLAKINGKNRIERYQEASTANVFSDTTEKGSEA